MKHRANDGKKRTFFEWLTRLELSQLMDEAQKIGRYGTSKNRNTTTRKKDKA